MFLIPLVEIKDGESVHVLQAQGQGESRPLMDPAEVVNRLTGLGAQGFHVVDVDHARDPGRDNDAKLVEILEQTTLPVVAGGGVRSLKRIQELLDTGVRRVLVGSMGVLHPDWLKEAALIFQDRLVACIDVRDGDVLVKGRTETAESSVGGVVERLDGLGLGSLLVSYCGTNGAGVDLAEQLAGQLRTPLTYSGPVTGTADLVRLEKAGIQGVVLGREIYDGTLAFTPLAKAYRVQ